MTLYLDTSVIVPLFALDPLSDRADKLLSGSRPVLVVSDFAAAEFTSVISRRYRAGDLTARESKEAFSSFDAWTSREAVRIVINAADLSFATEVMRKLDLPLRAADGVHLAIARRTWRKSPLSTGRWHIAPACWD